MEKYYHDEDGGEYGYPIEPDSEERVNRELYSAAERLLELTGGSVKDAQSALRMVAGVSSRQPEPWPVGLTTPDYLEQEFTIIRLPTPRRSLLTDEPSPSS
ncbi:MAG: hypothetical protein Q4F02_00830 [Candidatus Saccharibacteria bacterium]|nr:hypothetical protein [Candidatus Saccharibacteria bacterium]